MNEYSSAMNAAMDATRAGRLGEAAQFLSTAMRLDPASSRPYYLLAANFAQSGETDLAEGAYIACLSREPGFDIARFQLGLLQLTNSRVAAARGTWEALLVANESNPLRHFATGLLALLDGEFDLAKQAILEGTRLNTENVPLNRDMLNVVARAERAKAESAEGSALEGDEAKQTQEDGADSHHILLSAYRKK